MYSARGGLGDDDGGDDDGGDDDGDDNDDDDNYDGDTPNAIAIPITPPILTTPTTLLSTRPPPMNAWKTATKSWTA